MKEDETLQKCIVGLAECSEKQPCALHAKYKLIKSQLNELFDSMTIETFVEESKKGDATFKLNTP